MFKRKTSRAHKGSDASLEREPGDLSVHFSDEFLKARNYVDFLRAAIGGIAILGGIAGIKASVQISQDDSEWLVWVITGAQIAILLIGVLIQTFRMETRTAMYPPIFFLSGLSICLCGIQAAAFALIMIWAINTTLPGPSAFLSLYAVLAGFFGWLLNDSYTLVMVAVVLLFAPVLISLLTKRRLVHYSKKTRNTG